MAPPPPRKRTFEESMAVVNQCYEDVNKGRLADQKKIKELQTEVGQLKTKVGSLEKEFEKLKEELEKMKKKICDGCGAEHVNDTTFWSPKCRKNQ